MTPSAVSAATTPDNHHDWPAAWATGSLRRAVASQAYPSNLSTGRIKFDTHGDDDSVLARIVTPTKAAYTTSRVAT